MLNVAKLGLLIFAFTSNVNPQFTTHPDGGISHNQFNSQARAQANAKNAFSYISPEGQLVNVKYSTKATATENLRRIISSLPDKNEDTLLPEQRSFVVPSPAYSTQLSLPGVRSVQPSVLHGVQPQIVPSIQPQILSNVQPQISPYLQSQILSSVRTDIPSPTQPLIRTEVDPQTGESFIAVYHNPLYNSMNSELITPSIQPGAPNVANLFAPALPGTFPVESEKQVQAYNDYLRDLANETFGLSAVSDGTTIGYSFVSSTPNIFDEIASLANIKF